jgi:hypothetical protein
MPVIVTDQIIIINQMYTSGREMAGVGVGQYLRVDRKVRASFRSGWAIGRAVLMFKGKLPVRSFCFKT